VFDTKTHTHIHYVYIHQHHTIFIGIYLCVQYNKPVRVTYIVYNNIVPLYNIGGGKT